MGKGFDTFMENPYWRRIYEEAPGKNLKEYYRIMFDISPFIMGSNYKDEETEAKLDGLWISQDELDYLLQHASMAQAKIFYRKCISTLKEAGEEGLCVSARCLRGEIRNPWYIPQEQNKEDGQ